MRKVRTKINMGEKNKKQILSKKGVTMTCSLCHKPNHNKRGCPSKKNTQDTEEGNEVPASLNETG